MLCVSMLIFYHIIHLPLNIAFWPVIFAFLYQDISNAIDIVDIFVLVILRFHLPPVNLIKGQMNDMGSTVNVSAMHVFLLSAYYICMLINISVI